MRTDRLALISLGCAAALACAAPLHAQTDPAASATPARTAAAEIAREPAALAALDRMGQALRSLDAFSLTSDTSMEVVLDTGQKVELDGLVTYKVRKPDKLFVEIKSDRRQRQVFFDGKQLTLYSPRLKYYAQADTQARTLRELVVNAAQKYGVEFPLSDLFFWGTEAASKDAIASAIHIGAALLDGERADQYAYRQDDVDWQVWISQATSLPKKLVITSLDDPALPRYAARLHWDTRTPPDAAAFAFSPPQDAHRIELVKVDVAAADATKEQGR